MKINSQNVFAIAMPAMALLLCWLGSEFLFGGIRDWLIPGVPDGGGPVPLYAFPYFSWTYQSEVGNSFAVCTFLSWMLIILSAFFTVAVRSNIFFPGIYVFAACAGGVAARFTSGPMEWRVFPNLGFQWGSISSTLCAAAALLLIGFVVGLFVWRKRVDVRSGFDLVQDAARG